MRYDVGFFNGGEMAAIRLGIGRNNLQANHFWKKDGFFVIREADREGWTALVPGKSSDKAMTRFVSQM